MLLNPQNMWRSIFSNNHDDPPCCIFLQVSSPREIYSRERGKKAQEH